MDACILCLSSSQMNIGIFSAEGLFNNICAIIAKHFWLRPDIDLCDGQMVCLNCWDVVRDFHELYLRVAKAHNFFECQVIPELDADPLPPQELLPKSEESVCVKTLDEEFFNPEVKVEVNELDLLPQIEVFEETVKPVVRATRGGRRGRPTTKSKPSAKKRIKREFSPHTNISNSDSETELPLAMLMNVSCKTDVNNDPTDTSERANVAVTEDVVATEPQQKRRGRPRKVKEQEQPKKLKDIPTNVDNTPRPVKIEHAEGSESDTHDGREFLASGLISGTDDNSADSSSSESNDSDASWLDHKPKESFAVIPKRVVVKPKKYRKREKPLVPPKRMSREEIDARNSQLAEYDKVIAKYYEKFTCPTCSLLVQNFSDIKAHFRVSHNSDQGYILCCGRRFKLRKALAEHVYVHWNPEHFKCATCSQVFQESRLLEAHELSHTNPNPEPKEKKIFQCDKCPKSFASKATLDGHSISQHVPKSEFKFECTECNKKLATLRRLKDHINNVHNPESAYICDKCGKKVSNKSSLKKHHQIFHSDVPRPVPVPMQCETCGLWLRHLKGLKMHMRMIHEEAPGEHRCHICNKISLNSRSLRRHIYLNHECERKFQCTMCEKAFKRRQDLREHTSVHTGEVLYTCPNCPMTFFSNANMYTHRKRLHRAEWEADRKRPSNIMKLAKGATAAMKMQQAVGAASAFFANKRGAAAAKMASQGNSYLL